MDVKRARQRRQHRGEHEHLDPQQRGIDAERLRETVMAFERGDGAARPRGPQPRQAEYREERDGPDQLRVEAIVRQREAEQRQRWNLVETGRAAGHLMPGGEDAGERDAVSQRCQRQVVPAQPQRDEADQRGDQRRRADTQHQRYQCIDAISPRHQCRSIGAEPHESALPQRDLPGLQQQDEADGDQRIDSGIGEDADIERRQHPRHREKNDAHGEREPGAGTHHLASTRERVLRQSRMGISRLNTSTSR